MKPIHHEPNQLARCDDCGTETPTRALRRINDPGERLHAGEETPAGQCPQCGALAYLVPPDTEQAPDIYTEPDPPGWYLRHWIAEGFNAIGFMSLKELAPGLYRLDIRDQADPADVRSYLLHDNGGEVNVEGIDQALPSGFNESIAIAGAGVHLGHIWHRMWHLQDFREGTMVPRDYYEGEYIRREYVDLFKECMQPDTEPCRHA